MSIDISRETEAPITGEAQRQGVSVDELLARLMSERGRTPFDPYVGVTFLMQTDSAEPPWAGTD